MKRKLCLALALVLLLSAVGASAATVKYGSKGDAVRQVQTALKNLGYYKGEVDGDFGYSLYEAVWWFQNDKGLTVDGIAGASTQAALGLNGGSSQAVPPAGSLSYGASGNEVVKLQAALRNAGYYKEALDGNYVYSTFEAVWKYQRDQGWPADGIANPQVLSKLNVSGITPAPSVQSGGVSFGIGSTGQTVRAVQASLANLGYFSGAINGVYEYSTWESVWRFQRDKGLAADGVAGAKTLDALNIGYTQSTATSLPGGTVLSYGNKGEYVRILQNGLKNLGYFKGSVDGEFGYSTYEAVWWFQKNNGLVVDGKVNSITWGMLFGGGSSSPGGVVSGTLRYGDSGSAVLALQKRLVALKYTPGKLDGIFGQNTYNAVRDFQQNNKLTVDGVAGTSTLNALNSSNAITKP